MIHSAFTAAERPSRFVPIDEPLSTARRGYFSELIESVFYAGLDTTCKPIMFVSPNPGTGVSFIASYVATELAAPGKRVLLADSETLLMLGRNPAKDPLQFCERIDMNRLWVLGARQVAEAELVARGPVSLNSVISTLRDSFSHMVIDAPALSTSEDAIALATSVHGTVLIAQGGRTGKQEIVKICGRFRSLGGRVLGSIYNARPVRAKETASA